MTISIPICQFTLQLRWYKYLSNNPSFSYDGQNGPSNRRNYTFGIDGRNGPSQNDFMSRAFASQNDPSQFGGFDGYISPNLNIFARPANSSGMNYNDSCDMHERDDSRMAVSTRPVHNTYPPRMYHDENRRG